MADDKNKKPEDSDFQQQRLKAWQPLLTPQWVIATFAIIGIVFLPIGGVILDASNKVVEYEMRYDHLTSLNCNITTRAGCDQVLTFNITKTMKAPVYVYYKLSNYYQNHRRYVKSRSDYQLKGDSSPDTSTCDPLEKFNSSTLYPCGLIASSFFNDTFDGEHCTGNGCTSLGTYNGPVDSVSWMKKGIAWSTDVSDKFIKRAITSSESNIGPNGVLPAIDDEDFIVWMRTAGLPTFRKLYRKITDRDLQQGDQLKVKVSNVYPVSSFGGEKAVVISTTSWLGGKNDFLAIAYLTVGSLCILLALAFGLKHIISPRPLGDLRYFQKARLQN